MVTQPDPKFGAIPGVSEEEEALLRRRYTMIAEAAYFRAETRGFAPGSEIQDWLEAEAGIDGALGHEDGDGDIRKCVRDLVVGEGTDLSDRIRLLLVRTLASRRLDAMTLKNVVSEMIKGAEEGRRQLGNRGEESQEKAMRGVEQALFDVAEAVKLTVEEAEGRMTEFASDDLRKMIDDLLALKALLDDVLHDSAANAGNLAQVTLNELAGHARVQGARLMQRVDEILAGLGDQMMVVLSRRKRADKAVLQEKLGVLAELTTTALRSIADRLEHGQGKG